MKPMLRMLQTTHNTGDTDVPLQPTHLQDQSQWDNTHLKQRIDKYIKAEREWLDSYHSFWLQFRIMTDDERLCLMTGYIHQTMTRTRQDLYEDVKTMIIQFLYAADNYRSVEQYDIETKEIASKFKRFKSNAIEQMKSDGIDPDRIDSKMEGQLIVDNKHVFMLDNKIQSHPGYNYIKPGPFVLIAPNKLEYTFAHDKVCCYTLSDRGNGQDCREYFWTNLAKLGINPYDAMKTNKEQAYNSSDHSSEE